MPSKRSSPMKQPRPDSSAPSDTAPSAACASLFTTPSSPPPLKPSPALCANSSAPAAEDIRKKTSAQKGNPPARFVGRLWSWRKYVPHALPFIHWSSDEVEEQNFCLLHSSDLQRLFCGNGGAVAFTEFGAVQLDAAPRYLDVGVPVFLYFVFYGFARAQQRRVQLVALPDFHGAFASIR